VDRGVTVEPVERVADHGRVDGSIGERDLLRLPVEHLDIRELLSQHAAHRLGRLDRDDRPNERDEQARELTGAGGQVQDPARGVEPQLGDERGRDPARVAGSSALVDARGLQTRSESPFRERVAGMRRG
jgi:hypothetical protein